MKVGIFSDEQEKSIVVSLLCRSRDGGSRGKIQGHHYLAFERLFRHALQRDPESHPAGDSQNAQPAVERTRGRWNHPAETVSGCAAENGIFADGSWENPCADRQRHERLGARLLPISRPARSVSGRLTHEPEHECDRRALGINRIPVPRAEDRRLSRKIHEKIIFPT